MLNPAVKADEEINSENSHGRERSIALSDKVSQLKDEYSTAELLAALGQSKQDEGKFHGSLGSNMEVEHVDREDGLAEGKIKFTLAQGNFRHDDLQGWDFGFYSGREELYNGNITHANYNRGVNSIHELFVNRTYKMQSGYYGWGTKLAMESADKRTTPEVKIFGGYNITERLTASGYAMYHVEYKRNAGEFDYWEMEPGLGYKLNETTGMWLNVRYQEGQWQPKSGNNENEREWFIKPGVWHNWGKLTTSLWGEFGIFDKEKDGNSDPLWREKYAKYGVSANYPLTTAWNVFGEFSYKSISYDNYDYNNGGKKNRFGGYIPLFVLGVNYNF
ncbi:MAG: OmpG porin family protein [Shewanella sp.]|uniref:OmpG porin family protein n=1 Tax=Shewanella sp. TaxID=50422 RepID=UPI003F3C3DF6